MNDPTNWNASPDFGTITFATPEDAKNAELLFGKIQRERDEYARVLRLIAELEYVERGLYTNAGKVAQQMAKTALGIA